MSELFSLEKVGVRLWDMCGHSKAKKVFICKNINHRLFVTLEQTQATNVNFYPAFDICCYCIIYFFLFLYCRVTCKIFLIFGKHIQQNRYYSIVILTFLVTISIDSSLSLDIITYIPFLSIIIFLQKHCNENIYSLV